MPEKELYQCKCGKVMAHKGLCRNCGKPKGEHLPCVSMGGTRSFMCESMKTMFAPAPQADECQEGKFCAKHGVTHIKEELV